jgi:hypothetical protein
MTPLDRLEFVIRGEMAMGAGDPFARGELEGLRQVYDWALAGRSVRDRIEAWVPPETMIREERQRLAGFRCGLERAWDIFAARV